MILDLWGQLLLPLNALLLVSFRSCTRGTLQFLSGAIQTTNLRPLWHLASSFCMLIRLQYTDEV